MCCSNLWVARPQNADRCWQSDGRFVRCSFAWAKNNDYIYLPSQLYNVFPLPVVAATSVATVAGATQTLSQHVKLGCGSWLMADCHKEEAAFIWCVCRQQNNDQQHRNGFPHSDKITVCQLPFMIAETFSFYIMSWLTVPSIAWPSILSDLTEYWRASCLIINLNQPEFSKTGIHPFYIINSICLWR